MIPAPPALSKKEVAVSTALKWGRVVNGNLSRSMPGMDVERPGKHYIVAPKFQMRYKNEIIDTKLHITGFASTGNGFSGASHSDVAADMSL